IMIEQSIKISVEAYVFEPNSAATWTNVKALITNFLNNAWKQGGLAGATPEEAFRVDVGLGSTMTSQDILEGKMKITVQAALVRPAEYMIFNFEQDMQAA
ncbi:MAG: phage tail sheath C-terminal domain-containing protein, partial [Bacteroidota bacterium]